MVYLRSQLTSIQALRAVAALLVLIFHFDVQLHRLGYAGSWAEWPQRGVDIFFIISGVVMYLTTAGRQVRVRDFYVRRILRIIPLYYVLTLLLIVVLILAPNLMKNSRLDWEHVAHSFLFLPSLHPTLQKPFPVLIPGWTLNCEMLFYAVFGATLVLPEGSRIPAATGLLASIVLVASSAPESSAVAQLYGWSIMLEFCLGLGLGAMIQARRLPPAPVAALLLAGGAVALASPFFWEGPRLLVGGLPALAIVTGAVALEAAGRFPVPKAVLTVGDASYALYLSQQLTIAACTQLFIKAGLAYAWWTPLAFIPFALCVALAVAIVVNRFVELPLHRQLSARLDRRPLAGWRSSQEVGAGGRELRT